MELSTYRLCRKHHLIAAADRTATECIGSSRHGRCHHSRFRRRLLLGGLDHHLAIEHLFFLFFAVASAGSAGSALFCQRHPDKSVGRNRTKHFVCIVCDQKTRTASPLPFDSSLVVELALVRYLLLVPYTYLSWVAFNFGTSSLSLGGPVSPT